MIQKFIKKAAFFTHSRRRPPGFGTPPLARHLHSMEYKSFQKMPVFHDRPDRKYIFIGVGSIGRPVVHLLDEFIKVNYQNVHLVDQLDISQSPSLQTVFAKGAKFTQKRLEDEDWEPFFQQLDLKPYDVVIDLTTDTHGLRIIETLKKMSVMYVNTAQEINWHYSTDDVYQESLLIRTHELEKMHLRVSDINKASHLYDFGMNPGVISHFAIKGLLDVAQHVLSHKKDDQLADYVTKKQYNLIAKHLELHTIHSSELDTQIAHNIKDDGTFINTWSVYGLLEEGCEPAQVGWGTHERYLQEGAVILGKGQVGFKGHAYKKLHRSYVPDQEIIGMVIPHGECVSLNKTLTAGNYSPTVHYVYQLPIQTKQLMDKMTFKELNSVKKWRVLNPYEDDLEGEDRVGALLIFPKNPITGENKPWTYWFGSILGQGTSKYFGPTSIQVCSGVLTAIKYIVENNSRGHMFPEDVPLEYVLNHTFPYMGRVVSSETKWCPTSTQFMDMSIPDRVGFIDGVLKESQIQENQFVDLKKEKSAEYNGKIILPQEKLTARNTQFMNPSFPGGDIA